VRPGAAEKSRSPANPAFCTTAWQLARVGKARSRGPEAPPRRKGLRDQASAPAAPARHTDCHPKAALIAGAGQGPARGIVVAVGYARRTEDGTLPDPTTFPHLSPFPSLIRGDPPRVLSPPANGSAGAIRLPGGSAGTRGHGLIQG